MSFYFCIINTEQSNQGYFYETGLFDEDNGVNCMVMIITRAGLKQLLQIIIVSLEVLPEKNMLSSFVESLSFGVGYLVCQGLNLGGLVSTIF